jgi:hypothetical protein
MTSTRFFAPLALCASLLACSVGEVDYAGKSCLSGVCPSGWSCDPKTHRCVAGPSTTGTGTGAGGATSGGVGGGSQGELAPDWTVAFTAVYRFERPAPDLGSDATGHGHNLLAVGAPSLSTGDFTQGTASVAFSQEPLSHLESPDVAFETPAGTSFTTGGWFRRTSAARDSAVLISRSSAQLAGFRLVHDSASPGGGAYCDVGISNMSGRAQVEEDAGEIGVWTHLICRYDDPSQTVTVFVAGQARATGSTPGVENGTRPFQLGCDQVSCALVGNADEVFHFGGSMDDAVIARLWACGVDGSLCRCRAEDPTTYESCGRAEPDCSLALPACNAMAP